MWHWRKYPNTKLAFLTRSNRLQRSVYQVVGLCALLLAAAIAQPLYAIEVNFTGIIGYGTNLRPDGGFLGARGPSSFPLNDSGIVLINTRYSNYPDPGDGFLLTIDSSTHSFVSAAGPGYDLGLDGFAINNLNTLTYQRGPIFQGTPPYYQFFSLAPPYTNGFTDASQPCPCYSLDVFTNSAGSGVTLVRDTALNQPQVIRLNGDGTTTALTIDPTYLGVIARPAKILENGDIYVALLNYGNQNYEIWRFAAGETATHTVVYSIPASQAGIFSWNVNQNGSLVVSEYDALGQVWVKRVLADGSTVEVQGTRIGGSGSTITHAVYSGVFINSSGRIAAVRNYTDAGNGVSELLYVDPGSSAAVVLRTGDSLYGGVIINITPTSEMNESGQLTIFMQVNVSPISPPISQLVVRVDPIPSPAITGFSPTSGPIGTSVAITGTSFTGVSEVNFNGTNATFTGDSDTQITAMVPIGATSGPIAVTTPGGTATSSTPFTVTTVAAPTITSISPAIGGVGTTVTIKGTNFSGTTAVRFNGTNAAFKVKGSQITATVPAGATSGPITVTTPGGTATSALAFTVVMAPTITDFSPSSANAGTIVTITGTNFTGATAVKFNNSNAKFTVLPPNTITATVPNGAKSGPISVTGPGGTATSTSIFTVTK